MSEEFDYNKALKKSKVKKIRSRFKIKSGILWYCKMYNYQLDFYFVHRSLVSIFRTFLWLWKISF